MQGGGKRRAEAKGSGAESQLSLDPLRRFVVFLESFAPLVNSLNLGIASPFLLGPPPPLQLAHIKTQLALQQLNSVASSQSVAPYALLNEAFLKAAMFNPRGNMAPRPRRPNPPGPMPQGPFQGPGPGGLQRQHPASPTHRMPQRFMGPDIRPGFPRPNVPGNQHRMDPRQMGPPPTNDGHAPQWDNPFPSGNSNQGQPGPGRMAEPSPPVQRRYTNESASSILASFGLSNEDLEELSRYPDDQLTPENMPLILRNIRMRKTTRPMPGLPQDRDNKESFHGDDGRGPMVKGKVIDYGHESKYEYDEGPLELNVYSSDIEAEESAKEFQAPHSVTSKQMHAVEELIRQMGFQRGTPSGQSFFPMDTKPPVPPMMPPVVPSAPPPNMPPPPPPIMPPMMPDMSRPPPPFVPEVTGGLKDRTLQESKASHGPRAPVSSQKKFSKETEGPISSPFGVVKASWLPNFAEINAQKMKRLPTPSMMNDYYAMSPRIFPHICSLCNVEFRHLQDWIEHQNSSTHLESCRQLRQQYPDWNPESLSSPERHESSKKENHSPKRRTSGSSPKRSRRSSSSHARRRTRSRSRSPRYYRAGKPRSRSRERSRSRKRSRSRERSRSRMPSRSRVRSRSPRRPDRSWSPVRSWTFTSSYLRRYDTRKELEALSRSADRASGSTGRRLGTHKHESSRTSSRESSGKKRVPAEGEKKPSGSSTLKTEAASADAKEKPSDAAGEPSKAGTAAPRKEKKSSPVPENWLLSSKAWSCGTVLHISDLPDDGYTEQDITKIVQPFGKVSSILVLHSKKEAYLEMNFKEAVIAAVKYAETTPVLVNEKHVKIEVAEKSKVTPSQSKGSQKSTKKPPPSTKKDQTKPVANPDKPTAAEAAASKASDKKPAKTLPKSGKTSTSGTQKKPAEPKKLAESKKPAEPKKAAVDAKNPAVKPKKPLDSRKAEDAKKPVKSKVVLPKRSSKHEKKTEKPNPASEKKEESKEAKKKASEPVKEVVEERCVVAISSLPDAGLGLEEVLNLTKPFGKLKDILILSSHKKAYIEISRNAADLMVKFYTCFPMWVEKNQLSISLVPEFKDLKDEEAIFISLIKEANAEVKVEGLHTQFVHLGNLPDKGYSELEILCVGLRFGRVDHYMVIANKNKAILQLDSAESAASMCRFLTKYPYSLGDLELTFWRSPRVEPLPPEVLKKLAKKQEPKKASPDTKAIPEGSAVVPPSLETKEEPSRDPKAKVELSGAASESLKTKTPGEGSAVGAPTAAPEVPPDLPSSGEDKTEEGKLGAALALPSSSTEKKEDAPALSSSTMEKKEDAPALSSSSSEKKEDVPADSHAELQGNAGASAEGNTSKELGAPTDKELAKGLSGEAPRESSGAEDSTMAAEGENPQDASGLEAVPAAPAEAPAQELPGTEQVSEHKPAAPEAEKIEPSIDMSETPVSEEAAVVDKEPESSLSAPEQHMEVESEAVVAQTQEDKAVKVASPPAKAEAAVKVEAEEGPASNNGAAKEEKSQKNAKKDSPEQALSKKKPSKGPARSKTEESRKAPAPVPEPTAAEASSASKTILKALLSVPNVAQKRAPSRRKAGHNPAVKPGTRSQARREEPVEHGPKREHKRSASRETSHERLASAQSDLPDYIKSKPSASSLAASELGNEKTRSQPEKDPQADTKGPPKQRRERENRSSSLKRDSGGSSNKASAGRSTRSSRSSTKPKQEEELSSFNLDEFVTMDEVTDEMDSPSQLRRNPARGKRKEPARKKEPSYEPSSKRKKSKASAAESEVSFVTLDEIGEDEGGAAQAEPSDAFPDPRTLVTVDEVNEEEEEELMDDMMGDPQALVTLDEISEQEEPALQESPKKAPEPSKANLKAEPLVTLDEISEQEEPAVPKATKEATEPCEADLKAEPLVTLDEISEQEELATQEATKEATEPNKSDLKAEPLVTLDEISEQEELAVQKATKEATEPSEVDLKAEPLVTLDEISEQEELAVQEATKEATEPSEADLKVEPLVTLDEISEQEEPAVQEATKEASASGASEADPKAEPSVTVDKISEPEERAVHVAAQEPSTPGAGKAGPKAEPLVTVDEVGEVEELPPNKEERGNKKASKPRKEEKQAAEDPSQMPEDPGALVTVDEIHEDSEDQPLMTLDEVTEDEEDFMEDFNCLKEEFNFVTVDEVGSEEEEEEEEGASANGKVDEPVAQAVPQKEGEEGGEAPAPADEPAKDVGSSSSSEETAVPESCRTEEAADGEKEKEEEKEAPEAQAEDLKKEQPDAEDAEKEGQEATLEDEGKEKGGGEGDTAKTCEAPEAGRTPELPSAEGAAPHAEVPMETESGSHGEESAGPEAADMEAGGSSASAPEEEEKEKEKEAGNDAQAPSRDAPAEDDTPAEAKEPEARAPSPAQDPGPLPEAASESGGKAAPAEPPDEKPEKDLAGSESEEPEAKRRKVDSSEKPKATGQGKGLDFLVPKAGFFCQMCSSFCVDEASMKSHCETELHQQNMEKFMKSSSAEEKVEKAGGGGKEAEKPSSA
nr:zinc finger protein 638 isoform X1 [Anolis sagrei ordinatus]